VPGAEVERRPSAQAASGGSATCANLLAVIVEVASALAVLSCDRLVTAGPSELRPGDRAP
jgi:hypothetical protein